MGLPARDLGYDDEAAKFWELLKTMIEHRAGYAEEVKELVGPLTRRWWTGTEGVASARYEGGAVTWILAPDEAAVDRVLKALD